MHGAEQELPDARVIVERYTHVARADTVADGMHYLRKAKIIRTHAGLVNHCANYTLHPLWLSCSRELRRGGSLCKSGIDAAEQSWNCLLELVEQAAALLYIQPFIKQIDHDLIWRPGGIQRLCNLLSECKKLLHIRLIQFKISSCTRFAPDLLIA